MLMRAKVQKKYHPHNEKLNKNKYFYLLTFVTCIYVKLVRSHFRGIELRL